MADYQQILAQLSAEGNLRALPSDTPFAGIDFSANDYLGLAARTDLADRFFDDPANRRLPMSASASRLLAPCQSHHARLEALLRELYGREVLIFNSGYHANVGTVTALAQGGSTLIVADRLVHASIIDGIILSRSKYLRYPHNDYDRLEAIIAREADKYERVIIVTESVFSMDGDRADIERLVKIKQSHPNAMLYVDEAHAFGVLGRQGLGLSAQLSCFDRVDVIVGTFGKAANSSGAFVATAQSTLKDYLLNRARSFIFSTALSPMTMAWTRFMVEQIIDMDSERAHVEALSRRLCQAVGLDAAVPQHIAPLIVGDAAEAVAMSSQLKALGFKALPIRTPTVPPGTERLRFSVSAAMSLTDIDRLAEALIKIAR